jgi:hypothetical protein
MSQNRKRRSELKTDGNVARAETKAEIVDDLKGTLRRVGADTRIAEQHRL